MEQTNKAAYDGALAIARTVGTNFKTLRDNKRKLAFNLVCASVVEGFALAEAITDAKKAMRWGRLDSTEQNQMNVLFTAVRVIDGAWKILPEDKRKAFLAGEIVYSTLAKDIKDAEKAALAKDEEATATAEAGEEAASTPVGEDGRPVPEAPEVETIQMKAVAVTEWLDHIQTPGGLGQADALIVAALAEAVSALLARAAAEQQAEAA